jgi:hypothetical protein
MRIFVFNLPDAFAAGKLSPVCIRAGSAPARNLNRLPLLFIKTSGMKLLFISATSRWRSKARKAESAYREAIRRNLEFSETKKLYIEYKRVERELHEIMVRKAEERMGVALL